MVGGRRPPPRAGETPTASPPATGLLARRHRATPGELGQLIASRPERNGELPDPLVDPVAPGNLAADTAPRHALRRNQADRGMPDRAPGELLVRPPTPGGPGRPARTLARGGRARSRPARRARPLTPAPEVDRSGAKRRQRRGQGEHWGANAGHGTGQAPGTGRARPASRIPASAGSLPLGERPLPGDRGEPGFLRSGVCHRRAGAWRPHRQRPDVAPPALRPSPRAVPAGTAAGRGPGEGSEAATRHHRERQAAGHPAMRRHSSMAATTPQNDRRSHDAGRLRDRPTHDRTCPPTPSPARLQGRRTSVGVTTETRHNRHGAVRP